MAFALPIETSGRFVDSSSTMPMPRRNINCRPQPETWLTAASRAKFGSLSGQRSQLTAVTSTSWKHRKTLISAPIHSLFTLEPELWRKRLDTAVKTENISNPISNILELNSHVSSIQNYTFNLIGFIDIMIDASIQFVLNKCHLSELEEIFTFTYFTNILHQDCLLF